MKLNFTALQKALNSLEIAIKRSQSHKHDKELRDAVIQRFEYTFELSFKFLKRVLELESPSPMLVDQMSYKDILREACEKGFIDNFHVWVVYRDQRNITSHTYNENKAESVYQTALTFYNDALKLSQQLMNRSND